MLTLAERESTVGIMVSPALHRRNQLYPLLFLIPRKRDCQMNPCRFPALLLCMTWWIVVPLTSFPRSEQAVSTGSDSVTSTVSIQDSVRILLMQHVINYLGIPYHYGGNSRKGMDCSAFTYRVFSEGFGIELPRSTRAQYHTGVRVKKRALMPGDLLFFRTRRGRVSHVGIYVGEGLFAHASINHGITISPLESPYYKKRYAGAKRVIYVDNSE